MEDNRKYQFYRKPPSTKPPEVKHTKTSLKRIIQANPLIDQQKLKTTKSSSDISKNKSDEKLNLKRSQPLKRSQSLRNPPFRYLPSRIISGNGPKIITNIASVNFASSVDITDFHSTSTVVSSTFIEKPHHKDNSIFKKPSSSTVDSKSSSKPNIALHYDRSISNNSETQVRETARSLERSKFVSKRRSLSAQHYEKKRGIMVEPESHLANQLLTQSMEDVAGINQEIHAISPIMESSREGLVFKTPSAYERRSIARFTPRSGSARRSVYRPSTPLPSLDDLEKRLNAWLLKRGKNVTTFQRLKNFAVENLEENKENVEVNIPARGSNENLCISSTTEEKCNEPCTSVDIEKITKEALSDLLRLIREGYPVACCEQWLSVIKGKYNNLQKEPEYWECRAAIEESRGNIGHAVDCYKTAIVRGAEVSQVDKSLDTLLQKFSLLNISPPKTECPNSIRDRERIIKDARNVFKSSIIKFAVQAKKLKENNPETTFVVTPVRRSSRISRSAYTSTPGVKIYSTLREVNDVDKEKLNFHPNKALD